MLSFLFFLFGLLEISYATYYAYVRQSGTANTLCNYFNPCPTIQTVINNINNGNIQYDDEVYITVTSTYYGSLITESYCFTDITGNITIDFNSNFVTASDWFPRVDTCVSTQGCGCISAVDCDVCTFFTLSENSNLKMYNLIWDKSFEFLDTLTSSTFYCENCIIENINMETSNVPILFLFANKASFYNSTFDNIIIKNTKTVIGLYPWQGTLAAEFTDTSLNISHCVFTNIVGNNFITIESRLNYKKSVNIEYSTFSTSATASGTLTKLIYASSDLFLNAINTINILSCTFTDTSNHDGGFVLIDISGSANCDVFISDTQISYSQYLSTELLNTETAPTGIVINNPSRNTNIEMDNVIIITQIHCSYDYIYIDVGRRRNLLQAYSAASDLPFCNSPTPFLLNNGQSKLTNISLQTDYNWNAWLWYFYSNGNTVGEYRNGGVYFLRLEYYDTTLETDNEPYFAAIVNFEDGIININDFNVAIGSHFSILYNQEGIVNIKGLYSQFHDDDQSNYYNRWNLRFYSILTNNFGTLTVSDSFIQGADTSLINIYGGDISIIDCILAQSMLNIVTYYTANSIYLENINVYEVGQYYASLGAAFYFSGSNEELYYIPPTFLSADFVTILNSFMYYIAPFGILQISEYGLFNIDDGNSNIKQVTIMNNSLFVTETVNNNQSDLPLYKGYKYLINFDYLSSLLTQNYGSKIPISNMQQFISDINADVWKVNGLVIFDGGYELTMANNFIYLDNKNFLAIDGQIYIDTIHDNCIAGNKFYNIDLYAKSGQITSCKHRNIKTTQINSCEQTFGVVNNSFSDGMFVNSSIIIDATEMVVIDDVYFDEYGNLFQIIDNDQNLTIILLDIKSSSLTDLKLPDYCNINCHQIINNNVNEIRQLVINCNSKLSSTSMINIKNNSEYESFGYWSAFRIVLTNKTSIFPGGTMFVGYTIVDKYNNIIEKYNSTIEIHLINTEININAFLTIDKDGFCELCEIGLYVQGISINDVNKSFIITTIVSDNLLLTNDISVTIEQCPWGYGISIQQCDQCASGTYSLESNIDQCIDCNEDELDGIKCFGGSNILIDYNYWMDIIDEGKIISSNCPSKYCCQHINGCDYVKHFNNSLCAVHRDPTIPLCGACSIGYSELLGTVNCGICDRNYYEYLLIPMIIAIIFAVYLLCFDQPPKVGTHTSKKQPQLTRNETSVVVSKTVLLGDDIRALNIMIFKVILYYGQGLLYIIEQSNINNGLFYFLLPILQFLNLSFEFGVNSSTVNSGYCVFKNMTAIQEILLNLVIPMMVLSIITIAICTKFCGLNLIKICCCCCKRSKGITYYSAFLKALLISIGSILAVLFKILSCRDINNGNMVHYYYGAIECFDSWWYLSLLVLIFILIIWCILFIKLYCMSNQKRQSVAENNLYTLVRAYKPKYWAWESMLLSRRFFLALFTIITDKNNYLHVILNILLCIYGFLHVWISPFKYKRINKLETLCILVLIIVLGFVNVNNGNDENMLLGLFLFICIVSPIAVVIYEGFKICKHIRKNKISKHQFQKVQQRKPGNIKQLYDTNIDQNKSESVVELTGNTL